MSPINFLFFIFGVIISVPLIIFGTSYFSDNVTSLAIITLFSLIIAVFVSLIIIVNREKILQKLYGTAKVEAENVVHSVQALAHNVIRRDLDKSLECGDEMIRIMTARYTWFSARKWMINVTIGVLAVFVGLAGSALIFKQNNLLDTQNKLLEDQGNRLKKQNKLLDTQNQLSEASRRSTLLYELTSILDLINAEISSADAHIGFGDVIENERQCPDESNSKNVKCPKRKISPRLKGRIAALSRSLRPYYFLEVKPIDTSFLQNNKTNNDTDGGLRRISRPLSPERAQLLISLVSNGLEIGSMGTGYNFTHSDLRSVNLHNTNLQGAHLDGANLENSKLVGTNLQRANLMSVNLKNASLYEANLKGAVLIRANLTDASLIAADLSVASMRWADFTNADMKKANINLTLLYGANLTNSKNLTAKQLYKACIDKKTTKLPYIKDFDLHSYILHSACE